MVIGNLSKLYPYLKIMGEEDENTEQYKKIRPILRPEMISDHIV